MIVYIFGKLLHIQMVISTCCVNDVAFVIFQAYMLIDLCFS